MTRRVLLASLFLSALAVALGGTLYWEQQRLTFRLAELSRQTELRRAELALQRGLLHQMEIEEKLARSLIDENPETPPGALLVVELEGLERQLAALEANPQGKNPLALGQRRRVLKRRIACYPEEIRKRVSKKVVRPCACAPGDPLCSCL